MSATDKHIKTITISHDEYRLLLACKDTITEENRQLKEQHSSLQIEYQYLKHELDQLKRMIFGSKSEKFVKPDSGQLSLGLKIEETSQQEPVLEDIAFKRKKKSGKNKNVPVRQPLPANLPRREETIEPDFETTGLKKIGEEITELLEYESGQLYVRKIIRPKYALPDDEGVVIADLPSLPIPKGNAGASLLAYILISKFVDHLPYYRQCQILKRLGGNIPESTVNGWFRASCNLLAPLYEILVRRILLAPYMQADETPIPVLESEKKGTTHKGYHWVYHDPIEKLVCFVYQKSRGQEGPGNFLKDFQGTLQTDGYAGYNQFEKEARIILIACMAHIRRYFEKASDNDPRAEYAMLKIQELYAVERKCRLLNLTYDQRKEMRHKESLPVMEELEAWLKKQVIEILPKSAFGTAVSYALSMWPRMKRYLDDGRYEIDNNLIENTIRPVALGRKNYLFAGSHEAAQKAAMMYSFLGTCKINDINPMEWLTDVIRRIPDHKADKLEELLPKNWKAAKKELSE